VRGTTRAIITTAYPVELGGRHPVKLQDTVRRDARACCGL